MTQMIHEGWLPNRLRMYWGKQIPLWASSPRHAFNVAVALNNRYFLDGRDANSYANIAWCVGGRHDRPFGPERPVTGLVRPMGIGAMKRSFDITAYLERVHSRWPPENRSEEGE
jgi:deoxyribodipyrimidine photo-lyase